MLNITHLFDHNRSSRYHLMVNHGLIDCSKVKLYCSDDVISLGKIIWDKVIDYTSIAGDTDIIDIEDALLCSDLIFRAGDEHFSNFELDLFMDQKGLWGKTVYYDFSDSELHNEQRLDQCKLYVKRVFIGTSLFLKGIYRDKILPLDYCLMPEYVTGIRMPRIVDMAYMFISKKDGINEDMRYEVCKKLMSIDWGKLNVYIGHNTLKPGENGRRLIFSNPKSNSFVNYINFLSACKVVWTCGPDHIGGDSRLWEAFGSGALVVTDDSAKKYSFIDGDHCLMYNLDNIDKVIEKVKQMLLLEDWETMAKIGLAGRNFALSHHRPIHRIQKVLDAVN